MSNGQLKLNKSETQFSNHSSDPCSAPISATGEQNPLHCIALEL